MERILDRLHGQVCQVDDILVFGETQQEHDEGLMKVLERLEGANVTLNSEKCKFSVTSIEFLGHVIGRDGVQVNQRKVEAITNMSKPTDEGQLRRLLDIFNQVGKYIENLAEMTKNQLKVLDIASYGSQSELIKMDISCFGK